MKIYVIVSPQFGSTIWGNDILTSITKKTASLRHSLEIITPEQLKPEIGQVIILGAAPTWVSDIMKQAIKIGVKPIAVDCYPATRYINTSYILTNIEYAIQQCLNYLKIDCGRNKTALYAVASHSYSDSVKTLYFKPEDIYYTYGLEQCYQSFLPNIKKYDSVLCSNYISATSLSCRLKQDGISVPDDIFIISSGDSQLLNMLSPSITGIASDRKQLGIQAVMLYMYIKNQKNHLNTTIYVPCKLIPRKSTNYIECHQEGLGYQTSGDTIGKPFLDDNEVMQVQALEKMLRACDDIDFKLIRALLKGQSYAQFSNEVFVSEGTLKYRIKRLLKNSGISSVTELLALYQKYIEISDIN